MGSFKGWRYYGAFLLVPKREPHPNWFPSSFGFPFVYRARLWTFLILSASGVWEQPRCLKSGVAQVVWSMAKLQDGGILEAPPGSLPLLAARIAEVGSVVVAGLCKPPK